MDTANPGPFDAEHGVEGTEFIWSQVPPTDEPARHRGFVVGVLVLVGIGTPWWQPQGLAERLVFGLPFWVLTSLAAAVGLSTLVAWATLRWWSDDEPPSPPTDSRSTDERPTPSVPIDEPGVGST